MPGVFPVPCVLGIPDNEGVWEAVDVLGYWLQSEDAVILLGAGAMMRSFDVVLERHCGSTFLTRTLGGRGV